MSGTPSDLLSTIATEIVACSFLVNREEDLPKVRAYLRGQGEDGVLESIQFATTPVVSCTGPVSDQTRTAAASQTSLSQVQDYKRGDVLYQDNGRLEPARVVAVHSETTPPHYTISLDGSERQTEAARLRPYNDPSLEGGGAFSPRAQSPALAASANVDSQNQNVDYAGKLTEENNAAPRIHAPTLSIAQQRYKSLKYVEESELSQKHFAILFEKACKDSSDSQIRAEWESHFAGVTPIVYHTFPKLLDDFIKAKRAYGSTIEKLLYGNMTPEALLSRMLQKRPLNFWLPDDKWHMPSGASGEGGWEMVGKENEKETMYAESLNLASVMSYDEVALSALVSVAVPTHFINSGGRTNKCKPGDPGTFERKGIYTGCVGARFERRGVMEWAHLIVTPEQNTAANGYGPPEEAIKAGASPMRVALLGAWARFYGVDHLPTYVERRKGDDAYIKLDHTKFGGTVGTPPLLDVELYVQRIRSSVEPFLQDANRRATEAGTSAYVRVVGLGLGAWHAHDQQGVLTMRAYEQILSTRSLPSLGVLEFNYFPKDCVRCGSSQHGTPFSGEQPNTKPTILFSDVDPAAPLPQREDPSQPPYLLVSMYAWDGNSYPGNEFWIGELSASGDPAAACCSCISLLQNPDINTERMSGGAALVYGGNGGVAAISDLKPYAWNAATWSRV